MNDSNRDANPDPPSECAAELRDAGDRSSIEPRRSTKPSRFQFSIASLMWWTLVAALMAAFVTRFQDRAAGVFGGLLVTVIGGLSTGLVLGMISRRAIVGAFWGAVIGASAFVSVVGELREGTPFIFIWTLIGIYAGGACGATPPRLIVRCLVGGAGSLLLMGTAIANGMELSSTPTFDVGCVGIVGALVGVLISLTEWIESRYRIGPPVTACWLLTAVIAGNLLVG